MADSIIIPCATEADWHAERAKAIGASEAAALVGEHPYLTALQLWTRKREGLADTVQEKEYLEAGHFAELMAAPWYAKRTGRKVVTPQEFYANSHAKGQPDWKLIRDAFAVIVRHPTLPLQCTPDRIVPCPGNALTKLPTAMLGKSWSAAPEERPERLDGVLQLKNADRWLLDQWEDDGQVTPPLAYQVQLAVEMMCTGFSWGALAAVIGGNRLRCADMERNADFEQKIGAIATRFWASLQGDLAPAPTAADLEGIKRRFPTSIEGLSCEYPQPEDVYELARVKAELAALEAQEKALLAKIAGVAGPAETITAGGRKLATYKSSVRRDPPREARETEIRSFRIDPNILKAAKAALPATHGNPILPPA